MSGFLDSTLCLLGSSVLLHVVHHVNIPQFKHSTVDGHLDSSQLGFIANNAAINIPVVVLR